MLARTQVMLWIWPFLHSPVDSCWSPSWLTNIWPSGEPWASPSSVHNRYVVAAQASTVVNAKLGGYQRRFELPQIGRSIAASGL